MGTENFALLRIIGAAFGYGFAKNVRDLYAELVHVYAPGDKLFLFGFSRGAYTIRALAGMIQYCGVLQRDRFEKALLGHEIIATTQIYTNVGQERMEQGMARL